jgi:predicted nucleotidyltransferase component of viral defense system
MEGFYLAGGTALSLFYYRHRESYDLDFFTQDFQKSLAEKIMEYVASATGYKVELVGEEDRKGLARICVYSVRARTNGFKIDFVEDVHKLIDLPKMVDGVPVLSLEDIYLRKIFAACGSYEVINDAGKKEFKGGRQEAKDLFDLFYLSTTFMPISKFAVTYCDPAQIESIVVWYRTFDRMEIKLGLQDIITDKAVDFQVMERYFRSEIERIIEEQL